MQAKTALAIAFILFLIGLPLISLGSVQEQGALLYLGLLVVVAGAALPPTIRLMSWVSGGDDEDKTD